MFGFGKEKKLAPGIDRRRSLEGVPILNNGVRVARATPENDHLVVTLTRGRGLLSRFQPPLMERTIKLDELGTFVLRQIDGRRTVKDIVESFMTRYRPNRREAELSTVTFLRSLTERKAISIIIK